MKKWYVYELVNLMGTVEYVGESINPKRRLYQHTKEKPSPVGGKGRFYGRDDIFINIVKEFDNKKDAWNYQCELQNQYGLFSDRQLQIEKAKLATKTQFKSKLSIDDKNEIRKMYKPHHPIYGRLPLAKKYNVWPATITNIIKQKTP